MPEHPLQLRLDPISGRPGAYTLTCATMHYPVTLDPERNIAFNNLLRRLPTALVGERDPAGELAPQALLRAIGTYLWQALFPDEAPAEQRSTLVRALRSGTVPLLLTLPDVLAGLPWELLCDPERGDEQGFLARRRPLLRFVPAEVSLPANEPPLRVLVLISSPLSLGEDSRVDVESEREAIEQATREAREAGLLHVWIEDFVTPKRVQQALMRLRPHIVHYIGHGGYDAQAGGILLWEDEQGNELPFTDRRLADLLRPRGLYAVVLHACQTGRRDAHSDVLGVAGTLVREGIPAVLAQQGSFTYASSQRASETWYTALTSGLGFADVLFEVRQALVQADRPDWAVPILYGSAICLEPLLDSGAAPGPPDPALASSRSADLPTPTGVFVGRHRELRALRLMLESPPGSGPVLALITGPGGVGKSTLAAQAVTRYGSRYKAVLTLSCLGYQNVELFLQRLGEWFKRQGAPGLLEVILPDAKLSVSAKIEAAIEALNQTGPVLLIVDNLESVQQDDQRLRDPDLLLLLQKLLTNLQGGRLLLTGRYVVQDLLPGGRFAAHLLHLDLDDLSRYETAQLLTRHDKLAGLGEITRQTLIQEFGGLPYVYDLLNDDAMLQSLDRLLSDIQGRMTEERQQRSAQEWQRIRRQVVEFAALETTVVGLAPPSRQLLARLSVLERPCPLSAIEQGLGAERAIWRPLLERSLLRYDAQQESYRLHSLTRHYAGSLLDEQERTQAQTQLAIWYEQYAGYESHNLEDHLEAHNLYRAAGKMQYAGELVMRLAEPLLRRGFYALLRELCTTTKDDLQDHDEELTARALHQLGTIAYLQGDYVEARHLYQQSLETFERLGDQSGKATTLHQLGMIAQDQGNYAEARRLYQRSLEIKGCLGDQSGKAYSLGQLGNVAYQQGDYAEARQLYQQSLEISERLGDLLSKANSLGQLGNIAYKQDDLEQALVLTIQTLLLLDTLHAPARATALRMLAIIRKCIEEDTFMGHWRTLAGERPLPDLPPIDDRQSLIQTIIDLIQAPTWQTSQQFLEAHPELLQSEVDAVLLELAAQQEHEGARKTIETHRLLLQRCREIGIAAAFAEQGAGQDPESTFLAALNDLCVQVIRVLGTGETEQREALSIQIEHIMRGDLPVEGAHEFLQVLATWLHGQDLQALERQGQALSSPFREVYEQMVTAVAKETGPSPTIVDPKDASALSLEGTSHDVADAILHGTAE
jgi:tetratricopeptide (TPR) repeat protein